MKLRSATRSFIKPQKGRHLPGACLSILRGLAGISGLAGSLLLFSCNGRPSGSVDVLREIRFDTRVGSEAPDMYYDRELQQELIYFMDKAIGKRIQFFDTKGTLRHTTPLAEAIGAIDNIGRISVVSLDTIVINSNYTNELLVIDRSGKILKHYSLENKLIDSLGNQYELCSSLYPIPQDPKSLLYSLSFRENLNALTTDTSFKSDVEELADYYKRYSESAFFVSIRDLLSDKPSVRFHCYGFYRSLFATSCVVAEPPAYFPSKDRILINSFYSDKLYVLNRKQYQPEQSVALHSEHSEIGTRPLALTAGILGRIQDSITFKQKTAGRIEKILLDKLKEEYYVIVRHHSTVKDYDQNKVPFSIIVLDKHFSQKTEHAFTDFRYSYSYTLLTAEGLLLFKNDTTKRLIKDEKVNYDLVKLP